MKSNTIVTTIRRFVRLDAATLFELCNALPLASKREFLCYRGSTAHHDPTVRNTPASHGALRSSHCIAPTHGKEGNLFHRAVIATVAIKAIFDTTIVTPTQTNTNSGARNHRNG